MKRRDATTTFDVLNAAAEADPAGVALVFPDRRITFGALKHAADVAAARLHERGVRPGDRVALVLKNSPEWAALFYALGRLGAVAVPVNPRFTDNEVDYALRQSGAVGVVAQDSDAAGRDYAHITARLLTDERVPLAWAYWHGGGEESAQAEALDTVFEGRPSPEPSATKSEDVAILQYTSGSTARPKGVLLRHSALTGVATGAGDRMAVTPDDRIFTGLPFFHIGGPVLHILLAHCAGVRAVGLPAYSAPEALRLLASERCTMFAGIETHFLQVLELPEFVPAAVTHLVKAISTGSPATLRRIAAGLELDMVAIYGLSETASNVAMSSLSDPEPIRIETCGYAQDGCEIRVADPESGAPLDADEVGEIQVRGYTVMAGYHEMEEATLEAFTADGWLRTGDLGSIDGQGCLRFVGRLKDVIRVGGENVSAAEVEDILYGLEPVAQAAVVPRDDDVLGEVPVAFVTLKQGYEPERFREQFPELLSGRMTGFKKPREVIVLDEMPQTGSGKIHKPSLKGRLQ